jgi:hypothetical protein
MKIFRALLNRRQIYKPNFGTQILLHNMGRWTEEEQGKPQGKPQ